MASPVLTRRGPVSAPSAVVLCLHGGTPHSQRPVGRSASWWRMAVIQRALARPLAEDGVATWLLRYRERGWNGGDGPRADARWALDRVRATAGDVPVVLLGHSMGARVAVHVADHPSVVGVLGLAPWWGATDPVASLAGRRVWAAHGRRDRITSFQHTAAYLARARVLGVPAQLVDMGQRGHYLLAGARAWHRVALSGVRAALSPTRPTCAE